MKRATATAPAAEEPIRCDYCDQPAHHVIGRATKELRGIVCRDHAERGRVAVVEFRWVDPPLPGRPRLGGETKQAVMARMRGYFARERTRAAAAAAPLRIVRPAAQLAPISSFPASNEVPKEEMAPVPAPPAADPPGEPACGAGCKNPKGRCW